MSDDWLFKDDRPVPTELQAAIDRTIDEIRKAATAGVATGEDVFLWSLHEHKIKVQRVNVRVRRDS